MTRELGTAAMSVFVGGFVIALVLLITTQVRNVVAVIEGGTTGMAYNATGQLLSAINLFITFLPLIVITIVGVLVLAYVGGLAGTGKKGR